MGNFISIQMALDCSIGRLWSCCATQATYVCHLQDNLDELKEKVAYLRALKNDVMDMLELEERGQRKRLNFVQAWLSRVEDTVQEAHVLIEYGEREIQRGCCSRNFKYRYRYGKRIAYTLKDVALLLAERDFTNITVAAPVQAAVVEVPTEPTGLDLKLAKVWSSLSKELVGIIGICGKEGAGKTTLLKQINKKFLNTTTTTTTPSGFDAVIFVTVSDMRLAKVQEDIGKKIGISDEKWKKKNIDEKAIDIFTVLHRKKFLLLLDDIWEPVDLANFGVPLPNRENGSKVVFTARSEDICREMEAQMVINMADLAWKGAIQEKTISSPIIAQASSRKYDVKLKAAARDSFKKKRESALRILTRSSTRMSDKGEIVEDEAQPSTSGLQDEQNIEDTEALVDLKHRYDSLLNDTVRFCFLYCTLFPSDFRISKDDLIHYWICEKFEDGYSGVGTYNEGCYIIDILLRAQLLEDEGKYVKICGVIRDMGLQMADKFLVLAGAQLTEAPEVGKWKGVRRISLTENSIQSLRKIPACPHLLTLFLSRNPCLVMISGDFFLSMKSLTVLDMSMTSIQELPPEISNLISLQYLNLSHTSINQLPAELNTLTRLRYLNLEHTIFLSLIPREVISQLCLLQILKLFRCGCVNKEVENNMLSDGNLHIEELQLLEHLKVLSMTIRHDSAFQLLFSTGHLRRCTQALYLEHLIGSASLNISWSDVNHQHNNELEESTLEPQLSSAISRNICFSSLQEVRVEKCFDLVDLTWLVLAPNLKILAVTTCRKMEEIISSGVLGQVPEVGKSLKVFAKLQVLELQNLPQMKSIYWEALAFPILEKIEVFNCPMLKTLPLDSNSSKGGKLVINAEEHWWNNVEWMDDSAKITFLPCFTSF
ncbi:putative disease resistance protein At4g10780 [Ricinus communis]|uniref:Disease resistance protein RFL1, putative n=1 Tax=Ricinus communis TaxID=3988 RepID=B9RV24_RICCO|nr:putative disease resistance protein At4g10780 [Ricinus communis]EEF44757.1 Disease resistance protein RFL1, putative [Ricinus communis]|eukprot:XP_002517593.1 putative disease resistance protein At4g10780 [Ricinus communis]